MIVRYISIFGSVLLTALSTIHLIAVWSNHPVEIAGTRWFAWTSYELACVQHQTCSSENLVESASAAPLSPLAFTSILKNELERDEAKARVLAEHIFARDPRSIDARIILANYALLNQDIDKFAYYYFPLFGIMRHDQRRFADPLIQLSSDPAVRAQALIALQSSPHWGEEYLLGYLGVEAPPFADLAPAFQYYPRLRGHLLSTMLRHGEIDAAYGDFVSGLRAEEIHLLGIPFNARFVESEAPRPFNWQVVSRQAEFLEAGGVHIFYQTAGRERFLTQITPLMPGRYHLDASGLGETSQTSGHFEWQIKCLQSGQLLANLELKELSGQFRSNPIVFDVPNEGCGFQRVDFFGVPGILSKPARITLQELNIEPHAEAL